MIELVVDDAADQMRNAVSHTRKEFTNVRTGRASSSFLERLTVEAYGVEMRLMELASFAVPEARMLVVTPHDASNLNAIEKAIVGGNLGLTPSNDGRVIRLAFPPLTAERRKELAKVVGSMSEEGKQRVNALRRAARKQLDELDNEGGVSKDEIQRAEAQLDSLKSAHVAKIERAQANKQQELMEV